MPLQGDDLYNKLISMGYMPSQVEWMMADDSDELPTPFEIDAHAHEDSDPALEAEVTAWWFYTDSVPEEHRRLLTARNAQA